MIQLKNVTKTFQNDKNSIEAVQDVSLTIEDGEIYGIIGYSGAGKSTLVRCINLLERPSSGEVLVNGETLTNLSPGELRRSRKKIGMIFQHFNLLPSRTVFGNIAYPLKGSGLSKEQTATRVHELLSLVNMEDKAQAYPSELSGGQKQRVAIARALANNPNVLLCDEATSALDPQTTHSILQLLKSLNARLNITIVLITHQMEVVKEICQRVAVMDGGRVVEEGEVFNIFTSPAMQITKEFIRSTSNLYNVRELLENKENGLQPEKGEQLVRLTYRNKNVSEALVSEISRRFQLDVNIIFGQIDLIQGSQLGGLVAILRGNQAGREAAIQYLKDNNVGVEVIANGAA